MTQQEMERYILEYFTARTALDAAKAKLVAIANDLALPRGERAQAAAAALDITAQRQDLDAAHALFISTTGPGLAGPSAQAIQRTEEATAALGAVLQQEAKVTAILQAVTAVVASWGGLFPPQPATLGLEVAAVTAGGGVATDTVVVASLESAPAPGIVASNLAWLTGDSDEASPTVAPSVTPH